MDTSLLLNEARASVGSYCTAVCRALCCRKGYLLLKDEKELLAVTGRRKNTLLARGTLEKDHHGEMSLDLSLRCPRLTKKNTCAIHADTHRPPLCADFPLICFGKTIIPVSWCPAVQSGFFDTALHVLEAQGFRILDKKGEKPEKN
ncbi:hypothetical protein COY95_02680 [Candidatus Woesearchaeota archaeon CG_4_10_14_0_8_um_filter_47_5]|nr:MAG: hypothetical protein COY95_02680 [Candidatus Woesearchaeota archaeon CG_4_10_14_0_8_um_filter_47_5]